MKQQPDPLCTVSPIAEQGPAAEYLKVSYQMDYTDPESAIADPHAVQRLAWHPTVTANGPILCRECGLEQREHINSLFCPEWRLRLLDGDR